MSINYLKFQDCLILSQTATAYVETKITSPLNDDIERGAMTTHFTLNRNLSVNSFHVIETSKLFSHVALYHGFLVHVTPELDPVGTTSSYFNLTFCVDQNKESKRIV